MVAFGGGVVRTGDGGPGENEEASMVLMIFYWELDTQGFKNIEL